MSLVLLIFNIIVMFLKLLGKSRVWTYDFSTVFLRKQVINVTMCRESQFLSVSTIKNNYENYES